jgi:hypothetical protein
VRRLSSSGAYDRAVAAIDAANAEDPGTTLVGGTPQPLALAHGRLAVGWVERLVTAPDDTLLLAARAHHLRRWEEPRASFPEGRAGYLRWRKAQKARHARDVEAILVSAGYGPDAVERVQALIRREHLGTDPGAQAVEDAACLVFLETQLAELVSRLEQPHLVDVIRKTAAKMSPDALALVPDVPLTAETRALLAQAL